MAGVASGFYVPYPGGVWLVDEPANWLEIFRGRAPFLRESFEEEAFYRELSAGISITGLRLGVFKFDFTNDPAALVEETASTTADYVPNLMRATAERVKIMNVFALCLHAAHVEVESVDTGSFWLTHEDLFHYHSSGVGGVGLQHLPMTAEQKGVMSDTISVNVIDFAANLLDDVLCHDYKNTAELVALLDHAVTSHKRHNFALAVVSSWTVCEALQNELWRMYYTGAIGEQQDSGAEVQLTKKRREKLEGRDFTASIVTEILSLAGALTPQLHRELDVVRSLRNQWLHGGKAPGLSDSGKALEAASKMLRLTLGLDITVGTGIMASGI